MRDIQVIGFVSAETGLLVGICMNGDKGIGIQAIREDLDLALAQPLARPGDTLMEAAGCLAQDTEQWERRTTS